MPRLLWIVFIALHSAFAQGPGAPLVPWTPGILDIHQIQTGRGNAAFFVFPDGTTMLLDAGMVPERKGLEIGPQRPDGSRSTAEWIAHYVRQFSPRTPPSLDYAVVTHYHDDHLGALPHVAGLIPIATLIDRGEEPSPPPYPVVRAYFDFRRKFRGAVQPLRIGRADQIVPRRGTVTAAAFEVRNVAGNGLVWNGGKADTAASQFPAGWASLPEPDQPKENDFSLALRISYGRFRYFTGGDLAGVLLDDLPSWHDMETPVARAVGNVDVTVLNHHGWLDSTNPVFLKTLNPRVVVIPAWHATHPDHSVLRRLRSRNWKPSPPDLFITTLLDAPRAVFSYLGESFKSTQGHVLIRVAPGGASYQVIVLNDESPAAEVKAVHGPYASRASQP